MTNKSQISNHKQYDLEERLTRFGKKIVAFYKKVPRNTVTAPIIDQGVKSGTSPGANYIEANEAVSKRDFVNRLRIARKEAKEARYWLVMTIEVWPEGKTEAEELRAEAKELVMIFSQMLKNVTGRSRAV